MGKIMARISNLKEKQVKSKAALKVVDDRAIKTTS